MFNIVLIDPQIPPNTGNIARICAATESSLYIVGNLGFDLSDSKLKRAGLDYWKFVNWTYIESAEQFLTQIADQNCYFFSTKAQSSYCSITYQKGDYFIFGSETQGLDALYLARYHDRLLKIPMPNVHGGVRSLNLANSVGIVLYEGLRQVLHW